MSGVKTVESAPLLAEASLAAYREFFALWKSAHPDIPILLAAKNEYAKLK